MHGPPLLILHMQMASGGVLEHPLHIKGSIMGGFHGGFRCECVMSGPGSCFCTLQKGTYCWGPGRPEANFMRYTLSTWCTGTLLRLALAQEGLTGLIQLALSEHALARALSGIPWPLPSQSTRGVKLANGGFSPFSPERPYSTPRHPS